MKQIEETHGNEARLRYYVVTHRLIVEAEDEKSAAQLAVGRIASASELAFEVVAEGTAKRVIVPAGRQEPEHSLPSTASPAGNPLLKTTGRDADQGAMVKERLAARYRTNKKTAAALVISVACLIVAIVMRYG